MSRATTGRMISPQLLQSISDLLERVVSKDVLVPLPEPTEPVNERMACTVRLQRLDPLNESQVAPLLFEVGRGLGDRILPRLVPSYGRVAIPAAPVARRESVVVHDVGGVYPSGAVQDEDLSGRERMTPIVAELLLRDRREHEIVRLDKVGDLAAGDSNVDDDVFVPIPELPVCEREIPSGRRAILEVLPGAVSRRIPVDV